MAAMLRPLSHCLDDPSVMRTTPIKEKRGRGREGRGREGRGGEGRGGEGRGGEGRGGEGRGGEGRGGEGRGGEGRECPPSLHKIQVWRSEVIWLLRLLRKF